MNSVSKIIRYISLLEKVSVLLQMNRLSLLDEVFALWCRLKILFSWFFLSVVPGCLLKKGRKKLFFSCYKFNVKSWYINDNKRQIQICNQQCNVTCMSVFTVTFFLLLFQFFNQVRQLPYSRFLCNTASQNLTKWNKFMFNLDRLGNYSQPGSSVNPFGHLLLQRIKHKSSRGISYYDGILSLWTISVSSKNCRTPNQTTSILASPTVPYK